MYCRSLVVLSLILLAGSALFSPSCRGSRSGRPVAVADPNESPPPITAATAWLIEYYCGKGCDPPRIFPPAEHPWADGRPSDFVVVPLPLATPGLDAALWCLQNGCAVWTSRYKSLLSGLSVDAAVFRVPYPASVAFDSRSRVLSVISSVPLTPLR
jgi:hypothetical protein